MYKILVQYRYHIRRTITILAWSILIGAFGLYLYLRITGTLDELLALRTELPKVIEQRDTARANNEMGLQDFKAALNDPAIQQIYLKPICGRMM